MKCRTFSNERLPIGQKLFNTIEKDEDTKIVFIYFCCAKMLLIVSYSNVLFDYVQTAHYKSLSNIITELETENRRKQELLLKFPSWAQGHHGAMTNLLPPV